MLYNQDCFEFLKNINDNTVDLALIDPPYLISKNITFEKGLKAFQMSLDYGEWDKEFKDFDVLIKKIYRVLKKNSWIICFYDIWKLSELKNIFDNTGFKQIRFLEWLKTNPVPVNKRFNYLSNAREIMLSALKQGGTKIQTFNSDYDNGIYRYPICHEKDRFHPTQKPIKLIEEIILKHTNENDLVLDCFSGSGTTMIACKNTNRNFIGCEISKEYYEKSLQRLKKCSNSVIIQDLF